MQLLRITLMIYYLAAEVRSEAFFVTSLLRELTGINLDQESPRPLATPSRIRLRQHHAPTVPIKGSNHFQHNQFVANHRPTSSSHKKPIFPQKTVSKIKPADNKFRNPKRYPNKSQDAAFKVDYSGWKPLGGKLLTKPSITNDVVTKEVRIEPAEVAIPIVVEAKTKATQTLPPVVKTTKIPNYAENNPPPAIPPKYEPTVKYEPKSEKYVPKTISYPTYTQEYVTKDVILPVFTPAPSYETVTSVTTTYDSEKFNNAGSPDSLPPIQENNLYVNNRLTKDTHKKKPDELYYIYFQDSEKKGGGDGDSQAKFLGLDGLDIPVYDYDEATVYRPERDQTSLKSNLGSFSSSSHSKHISNIGLNGGVKSSSSVRFKQNVGGQESEFSYTITQ